ALLLRFFEQRSLADVGRALGANEDAVRKRVERALQKVRAHLLRRGVAASASILSAALSAHAVQAAPAGLAATLAGASGAGAAGAGTFLAIFKMTTLTKLQLGAGALLLAGAATTVVLQHQAQARLRDENAALRREMDRLTASPPDVEARQRETDQANAAAARERDDLLRLRSEVTRLREQTNQLALLKNDNTRLRNALEQRSAEPSTEAAAQEARFAKMNDSKMLMLSFLKYSADHGGQFPTNSDLALSYIKNSSSFTGTNQFEVVFSGSIKDLKNPSTTIVLREAQPWQSHDKWMKTYAFADGHSEIHTEPNEDFEAWEHERMIPLD